MLRAKAIKFKQGRGQGGEKFLASTDVHGQFAGIPIVVQVVNAVNATKTARGLMEQQLLGVHPDAWMPELATQRFRWGARSNPAITVTSTASARRARWPSFATCYVNYNEPGIGHDLVKLLDHNQIPYEIVEKEQCCGMPKLELGDLDRWSAPRTPTSRCWRAMPATATPSSRRCPAAR
jgi:glycerol-3-phosphate dehydrogenase subunit C